MERWPVKKGAEGFRVLDVTEGFHCNNMLVLAQFCSREEEHRSLQCLLKYQTIMAEKCWCTEWASTGIVTCVDRLREAFVGSKTLSKVQAIHEADRVYQTIQKKKSYSLQLLNSTWKWKYLTNILTKALIVVCTSTNRFFGVFLIPWTSIKQCGDWVANCRSLCSSAAPRLFHWFITELIGLETEVERESVQQ